MVGAVTSLNFKYGEPLLLLDSIAKSVLVVVHFQLLLKMEVVSMNTVPDVHCHFRKEIFLEYFSQVVPD